MGSDNDFQIDLLCKESSYIASFIFVLRSAALLCSSHFPDADDGVNSITKNP
jgi:hypothetical protein